MHANFPSSLRMRIRHDKNQLVPHSTAAGQRQENAVCEIPNHFHHESTAQTEIVGKRG